MADGVVGRGRRPLRATDSRIHLVLARFVGIALFVLVVVFVVPRVLTSVITTTMGAPGDAASALVQPGWAGDAPGA